MEELKMDKINNKGLSDEDIKQVMILIGKANADECVAIAQRFNNQAQTLTNKAEDRLKRIYYEGEQ